MSQYLFVHGDVHLLHHHDIIDKIRDYANSTKTQVYVLKAPLSDKKYKYDCDDCFIMLSAKHKILFVNCGDEESEKFETYYEDVLDDIGAISDKYMYKEIIGRPRLWRNDLIEKKHVSQLDANFTATYLMNDKQNIRRLELIVSLFIGSINDVSNLDLETPEEILDKVKQKIQLFDGDQTNFIYGDIQDKVVTIQGLSGTGKTELLLHKLKELYTDDAKNKIFFTCHNKVLANDMRQRIPQFFNFMRIEQQIEWDSRLWCAHAWGALGDVNSGLYRYICDFYGITFHNYKSVGSFSTACGQALAELKEKKEDKSKEWEYAFTYILVDESQDFDQNFVDLCRLVAEKQVYVAGDIFQSIFEDASKHSIKPDFLLSKCYRTDPKTLMFAHALGMGLFEEKKLWWLNRDEWEDCGYNVEEKDGNYILTREPVRRFEDVNDEYDSVRILSTDKFVEGVVFIIKDLMKENPTLTVDDVGVILLDNQSYIYDLMSALAEAVSKELHWMSNIAYVSKKKTKGSLFITNINNVKGLEFPFVICLTRKVLPSSHYRTALYTMLTRSFLRSYLLLQREGNNELKEEIRLGYKQIKAEQRMTISIPKPEEIVEIKAKIQYEGDAKSQHDILEEIFDERNYDETTRKKLFDLMTGRIKTVDKKELETVIDATIRFI